MVMGSCIKIIIGYKSNFWKLSTSNNTLNLRDPPRLSILEFYRDCFIHNIFSSRIGPYPTLVCLVTGSYAIKLAAYSEVERKSIILNQIVRMYCKIDDILSKEEALNPHIYIEKNWCHEKFSGGCYAGIYPPGVLTSVREYMRSSFGHVHFASTENATEYEGYIEGAIRSGEKAADEIIITFQDP
jgi:monoamine oxidase